MKTLIIVDDELFFRKSICGLLKKQMDYEVVGEANNGKSGAELIRTLKPDIALVDISMPVMDGFEMIRGLVPGCSTKFIISTGYNDFAYAKQAITLGVKDYLLKPVDSTEFLKCLEKLSREIDEERHKQDIISDYYKVRNIYQKQTAMNFFNKAISGNCQQEEFIVLKRQVEMEDINWFVVLSLKLISANADIWNLDTDLLLCHSIVENICTEVFHKNFEHVLYINDSSSRQYILLGLSNDRREMDSMDSLCEHLIKLLKDTVHIHVGIFCGTPRCGLNGIKDSYEEAISVQHNNSYNNLALFYYYSQENLLADENITPNICQELLLLLRRQQKDQVLEYIHTYFNNMRRKNLHIRRIRLNAVLFISALFDFITECGFSESEFTSLQDTLNSYRNCENITRLEKMITDTYVDVIEQMNKLNVSSISPLIRNVQNHIERHFMEPGLRLESIAAQFFVSPQYLRTLFSLESHTTLSNYINTCRMRKAKEYLLRQAPSIQNTAVLCGFTDAGYFSKCFKKFYGISPKKFLALQNSSLTI